MLFSQGSWKHEPLIRGTIPASSFNRYQMVSCSFIVLTLFICLNSGLLWTKLAEDLGHGIIIAGFAIGTIVGFWKQSLFNCNLRLGYWFVVTVLVNKLICIFLY